APVPRRPAGGRRPLPARVLAVHDLQRHGRLRVRPHSLGGASGLPRPRRPRPGPPGSFPGRAFVKRFLLPVALLALPLAALAQTSDEKRATLAYVPGLQDKGGGMRATPRAGRPTLAATHASLRALRHVVAR